MPITFLNAFEVKGTHKNNHLHVYRNRIFELTQAMINKYSVPRIIELIKEIDIPYVPECVSPIDLIKTDEFNLYFDPFNKVAKIRLTIVDQVAYDFVRSHAAIFFIMLVKDLGEFPHRFVLEDEHMHYVDSYFYITKVVQSSPKTHGIVIELTEGK